METENTSQTQAEPEEEGAAAQAAAARTRVEKERRQFRSLVLANPNYFGNLPVGAFEPVKVIQSNTNYEELTCVGFHPQMGRLDAVVQIKRTAGYGGGVCAAGTPEYVRFYLSYDHGATWLDQGLVSFTAHDIPGPKPLSYDVRIPLHPTQRFCFFENLVQVRAILSWNYPPPANTPNFTPVYGNVREATIQVRPRQLIKLVDLLVEAKVKLQPPLAEIIDLEQEIPLPQPPELAASQLAGLYKEKGVPAHRFLFPLAAKMLASPELSLPGETSPLAGQLAELDINLSDLFEKLANTDGDTRYEELKCVGLNSGIQDSLAGVLTVKLPNGYSGKLCGGGSREYVAFWVDWGDGAGWTYAGTGSVNVYDIASIPPEGLQYAVSVPVDTSCRRQPCGNGPKIVRVRAILSWQTPPNPADPDQVPVWGNREEALVQIKPGPACNPNDHTPYMDTIGNMAVCKIDQATGLATGPGIVAAFNAYEAPFGGSIRITGFILNPPNQMAGAAPIKYRVSVRDRSGAIPGPWQPLANSFTITATEQNGISLPVQYNTTQSIDADGFYTYREQMYPNQWREVAMNVLASWETLGQAPGLWEVRLEAKLPDGTILPAGTILCEEDGTTRSTVLVRLDERAPSAAVAITGFSRGGGPVNPAVSCGTFQVGDVLHGTYSTFDAEGHFSRLSLRVEPAGPANGATVNPASRSYPVLVPTIGENGTWTLDTSPMDPCGYVIYLDVSDRTIVHSGSIGWNNHASAGFCLKAPNEG